MKISVIIPTYMPQSYLWECLGSMVYQTFSKSDFEVILVLNGCCEPYKTEIENYILSKMESLNIKLLQVDEGGVSNARNIGLDNANGDYITFIDDDDYVSSTFLEELYDKATTNTISLCYPYAFKDGEQEKQLNYRITDAYNHCIRNAGRHKLSSNARKFFSGPCMKLIPRTVIQDRRFDVRFKNGEDSLFMFLISDKIKNLVFSSKNAVYFRRYRDNSAVIAKQGSVTVIKNSLLLMACYTKIYISSPLKYNFLFYFTRLLGAMRLIVNAL